MTDRANPIEALLMRLHMSDLIPAIKEEGIERITALRNMSDEKLAQLIPDEAKREKLKEAVKSRGQNKGGNANRGPQALGADPNNYVDNGNMRGRGGRGGRGRGGPNNGGQRGGVCRHFAQGSCKYGDNCNYSHVLEETTERRERPERVVRNEEDYEFRDTVPVPTNSIKFLLSGSNPRNLGSIHQACGTSNVPFTYVDPNQKSLDLILLGHSQESIQKAIEMISSLVGVKKQQEQKSRFEYTKDELSFHTAAVKYLVAANKMNKGNNRYLSDATLKNIITGFRFQSTPDIRHFCISLNSNSDKDKEEAVSKIVAQLKGVQAVIFVDPKRVPEMAKEKGPERLARYFNGVKPLFMHRGLTKAERFEVLEKFKNGVPNENGVKERLLVATDDYAKLARKTVIPYVNLVIHFSFPKSEEIYLLQSYVAGRQGTVGVSLLLNSASSEDSLLTALKENTPFITYEGESSFHPTAVDMKYDTVAEPLTLPNAEPPEDWREHLNDPKPPRNKNK